MTGFIVESLDHFPSPNPCIMVYLLRCLAFFSDETTLNNVLDSFLASKSIYQDGHSTVLRTSEDPFKTANMLEMNTKAAIVSLHLLLVKDAVMRTPP